MQGFHHLFVTEQLQCRYAGNAVLVDDGRFLFGVQVDQQDAAVIMMNDLIQNRVLTQARSGVP